MRRLLVAVLVLCLTISTAWAHRVVDGDTVALTDGSRCRLLGVDAPEHEQPLGPQATARLGQLLPAYPFVTKHGQDRYGRSLCRFLDGQGGSLGEQLVREGLAVVYRGRPAEAALARAEQAARAERRGLWALPCFILPGDWRHSSPTQQSHECAKTGQ